MSALPFLAAQPAAQSGAVSLFGGQSPAPMNAPQAQQPNVGVQAGSTQTFIGRLAIIFGTGTNTGLFVYNGQPMLGNPPIFAITTASSDPYGNPVTPSAITDTGVPILIYSGTPAKGTLSVSIAPAGGTDSFGNAFPQGLALHDNPAGGSGFWFLSGASFEGFIMNFGTFVAGTAPAQTLNAVWNAPGPVGATNSPAIYYTSQPQNLSALSGGFLAVNLASGVFSALLWDQLGISATGQVTAATPSSNPATSETWHPMTLQNSWTNTSGGSPGTARYKLLNNGNFWVQGDISHASVSGNSQIFTMPTGYIPANPQSDSLDLVVATSVYATATATWFLGIDTSGNLLLHGLPAGTTRVSFNAIFTLD